MESEIARGAYLQAQKCKKRIAEIANIAWADDPPGLYPRSCSARRKLNLYTAGHAKINVGIPSPHAILIRLWPDTR